MPPPPNMLLCAGQKFLLSAVVSWQGAVVIILPKSGPRLGLHWPLSVVLIFLSDDISGHRHH